MNNKHDEIDNIGIKDTPGYKNLVAIRDFTVETRKMMRELEAKNKHQEGEIQSLKEQIEGFRRELHVLRAQALGGGATSR